MPARLFMVPARETAAQSAFHHPHGCSRDEPARVASAEMEKGYRLPTRLKCHVRGEETPPFASRKPFAN